MREFLEQCTNGLAVGSIYALIALGYTMVYGVLRLINFAHGDLFTYGAYLGMTLLTSLLLHERLGLGLGLAVLALMVMGLVAVIGVILERAAYRPLREYLVGGLKDFPGYTGKIGFNAKGDRVGELYRVYAVDAGGRFVLQP